MAVETRMEEREVSYVRCDATDATGQCIHETVSYQSVDSLTVVLDPAWLTLLWGVGDIRYFCCWDHMLSWTQTEDGNTDPAGFAGRLKAQAPHRDAESAP